MPHYWSNTQNYLKDLAAHNNRDWFETNKTRYETVWRAPALALIDALVADMAAMKPSLKAEARVSGSLRRINRDVRFSKDKTPYSARLHLVFWAGKHPNRSAGMHFVIHPDGFGFGAGEFGLTPDRLTHLRERMCREDDRANLLAAIAQAQAIGCDFDAPELKRLPKGYEADGDWEHLLRRKSIVLRTLENKPGPSWADLDQTRAEMLALTRACLPLISWLQA